MSDRELLELAAKVAGIELRPRFGSAVFTHDIGGNHWHVWNPLTDDGDAFRLMVKLGLYDLRELPFQEGDDPVWDAVADPAAATRRAITRAAAEIGRNLT